MGGNDGKLRQRSNSSHADYRGDSQLQKQGSENGEKKQQDRQNPPPSSISDQLNMSTGTIERGTLVCLIWI